MTYNILWHNIFWEETARRLDSDVNFGLSEKEIIERQKKFGKNQLPKEKPLSKTKIFFEQFRSPLIYILVIAGIITLFLKDYTDSIIIFGAIALNTIIGFFQENKTTRVLEKLKMVVKVEARAVRGRNQKIVDSSELVPGDIFILNPGSKVPADGRIIESYELKTNEMALTGEWLPAEKKKNVLSENTPLADRDNMVYMGTIVESGKGRVITTETGVRTEMGKIAALMRETKEERTPYQKKITYLSKIIGISIVIVSFLIFFLGILAGQEVSQMFLTAVAVAVAAIPEGLPIAATVILALGMQRILTKKGLVRKMIAAETLGSTSIIATDKTGTLTEGKMRASEIIAETKEDRYLALKIATICNDAFIENPKDQREKWVIRGSPTDRALLLAGMEAGFDKKELEEGMLRLAEVPFTHEQKYLVRAFEIDKEKDILYIAGAPEKLLEMSKYIERSEKQESLDIETREKINNDLENLTRKGLRVVAVAYKKIENLKSLLDNLVFVGLIALDDPLRKEAKEAIKICRQAGMRPIIVTGDHILTAKAVAEELGLEIEDENIIEGRDLEKISDEEFAKNLEKFQIYARVEPRHKMRIINAWQERGEVVAMTGDGINDAPALKKADIGVALGSGTDVAKEASDLILLTDNFSIIVAAVEEGRAIIDNIRKTVTLLVSQCFSEIILIGASIIGGLPLPILPAQILWENLIEGSPQGLALAFEPKEKGVMERKPENPRCPLLTRQMKVIIFGFGVFTDLILLGLFLWLLKINLPLTEIRTIIFAALTIDTIFYVFSCKNLRRNIWQYNLFSNPYLIFSVLFSFVMLLTAIYLPLFQNLLKTVPLNLFNWMLLLTIGIVNLILIETVKYYFIIKKQTN